MGDIISYPVREGRRFFTKGPEEKDNDDERVSAWLEWGRGGAPAATSMYAFC